MSSITVNANDNLEITFKDWTMGEQKRFIKDYRNEDGEPDKDEAAEAWILDEVLEVVRRDGEEIDPLDLYMSEMADVGKAIHTALSPNGRGTSKRQRKTQK